MKKCLVSIFNLSTSRNIQTSEHPPYLKNHTCADVTSKCYLDSVKNEIAAHKHDDLMVRSMISKLRGK